MTTWTNETKSSTAFNTEAKVGIDKWDDLNVAWDDPHFTWDASGITAWVNLLKPIVATFSTTNPFFLWLFWGTQSTETEGNTQWINEPKL